MFGKKILIFWTYLGNLWLLENKKFSFLEYFLCVSFKKSPLFSSFCFFHFFLFPFHFFLFPFHFFQFLKFQQKLEAAEGRQLRPSTHALLEVWPLALHPGQLPESTKEKKKKKAGSIILYARSLQQGACIPSGRRR